MKWETTPAFDADLRGLGGDELRRFRRAVQEQLVPAAERIAADPRARWPAGLRVKAVEGAAGIWEMTWSFAGPDGRATFEWIEVDGDRSVRWRRAGGHDIFRDPAR